EQKVFEPHRNALAELEHLFESDAQQPTPKHDVTLNRHLQPNRTDINRNHEE
uniref:hypothetical protein n=1 Tax=Acinetobacter baumannii TaxID=470 RepID=UPI000ADF6F02